MSDYGMGERTSYLTADEVAAIQVLPNGSPYALCNVSAGYFSIARHAGGCTFQGHSYTYIDGHDECVRDDVLKLVRKLRKKKPAEAVKNVELAALGRRDHEENTDLFDEIADES